LERQIVDVLKREIISTPLAESIFSKLKESVVLNWKNAFSHLDQPEYVHNLTQEGVVRASEIMNSRIQSGQEYVEKLNKKSPVMIVSNHLGTFKLAAMDAEELRQNGVTGPILDIYYPYVGFIAPFYPVTKILEDNVYEAAVEAPGKLGELFRATGNIDVPPKVKIDEPSTNGEEARRSDVILDSARELINKHNNAALVIFPEGGTTGKRSGGKIYELEKFKTGSFVIAAALNMLVLPVVQYFNTNGGFELGVLEPFTVEKGMSKEQYENIAESTRGKMQTWLNERRQATQIPLKP
jgi:hypothetical protein